MKRRFFLFAAPAIIAAPSLMRISALAMPAYYTYILRGVDAYGNYFEETRKVSFIVDALMSSKEFRIINSITVA